VKYNISQKVFTPNCQLYQDILPSKTVCWSIYLIYVL